MLPIASRFDSTVTAATTTTTFAKRKHNAHLDFFRRSVAPGISPSSGRLSSWLPSGERTLRMATSSWGEVAPQFAGIVCPPLIRRRFFSCLKFTKFSLQGKKITSQKFCHCSESAGNFLRSKLCVQGGFSSSEEIATLFFLGLLRFPPSCCSYHGRLLRLSSYCFCSSPQSSRRRRNGPMSTQRRPRCTHRQVMAIESSIDYEKKIRVQNFDRDFPQISLPDVPPEPASNGPDGRRASIKPGPDPASTAPGPTIGRGRSSEKTLPPNQSREQVKMAAV